MSPKAWIFCEKQLVEVDPFFLKNWQERLFFERLERKSKPVFELCNRLIMIGRRFYFACWQETSD
jgi:hypothetical protein